MLFSIIPLMMTLIITFVLLPLNSINNFDIVMTYVSMILSFVVIPLLFLQRMGYDIDYKEIGISKPNLFTLLLIAAVFIICSAYYQVGNFLENPIQLAIQIFPVALSEEIWARGALFYLLKKYKVNNFWIILISALIFAFVTHLNRPILENIIYRFPGGLLLAFAYYKTKKLEVPVAIHFLNNFIGGLL